MKRKKLLSMAVAGMLIAAQTVMPTMAAAVADGRIESPVSVYMGVLKVQVPTSMAVAIDQYELGNSGTQIKSGDFEMKNYSDMAVKVKVVSTAVLGSGITLVSEKASANSAAASAWLAAAAKTAAGSYDDTKTTASETIGTLTETNMNVAPFKTATKKAEQYFYLEKATGDAVYKLATTKDTNVSDKTYTKFYELTPLTSTSWTGDDDVKAAAATQDVYYAATDDIDTDGTTLTIVPKGDAATNAYNADNTYYTAGVTAVELKDLDIVNSRKYVYAAMGTLGTTNSTASFAYIGKLSERRENWTATDISRITIEYTISGVPADKYSALSCTYGVNTPVVTLSAAGLIKIEGLTKEANIKDAAVDLTLGIDGKMFPINNSAAEWDATGWSLEDGGTLKAQLKSQYSAFNNKEVRVDIKLSNGKTITCKQTVTIASN